MQVLTHLSYYYDGLSLEEVKTAVQRLLDLPLNAQKYNYNIWLERSSALFDEQTKKMLDRVEKLDLSNSYQLDLLAKHFG